MLAKPVPGNLAWEPVPGNLFLGTLAWTPFPGNPFLETLAWNPLLRTLFCLGNTCSWKSCLGNGSWKPCKRFLKSVLAKPIPGNLAWNLLGTFPGNLFLKTFLFVTSSWESCLGTSCWEPAWESVPGNLFLKTFLLVTSSWEPCLGASCWEPCLGASCWEPCLGTSCWEPLLGNLFLGTSWEPYLGTCSWEPCLETSLGNLFLGTLLGNLFLGIRFPTLRCADLAAPRDSLGKGDPSWEPGSQPCAVRIWLLWPAREPWLWLKTKSLRCWGIKELLVSANFESFAIWSNFQLQDRHGLAKCVLGAIKGRNLELTNIDMNGMIPMIQYLKKYKYDINIIQGSLEVKLPTIWTDAKQRWKGSERREE